MIHTYVGTWTYIQPIPLLNHAKFRVWILFTLCIFKKNVEKYLYKVSPRLSIKSEIIIMISDFVPKKSVSAWHNMSKY